MTSALSRGCRALIEDRMARVKVCKNKEETLKREADARAKMEGGKKVRYHRHRFEERNFLLLLFSNVNKEKLRPRISCKHNREEPEIILLLCFDSRRTACAHGCAWPRPCSP